MLIQKSPNETVNEVKEQTGMNKNATLIHIIQDKYHNDWERSDEGQSESATRIR